MASYVIPKGNLARLQEQLAKINRRAAKLGCPPITLTTGAESTRTVEDGGPGRKIRMVEVEVTGEAPKIGGWAFAGAIDHLGELPVLRVLPGYSAPVAYRTCRPGCDHCCTTRTRKATYLLVDEAGRWKQVGSSCLADFTGAADPHKAASYAEVLLDVADLCNEAGDEGWGDSAHFTGWDIEEYLERVAQVIRMNGWCPKSKADEFAGKWATCIVASQMCSDRYTAHKTGRERPPAPEPQDTQAAKDALAWALMIDSESPATNDFLANVHAVAVQGYVPMRHEGIAAALVAAHQKAVAERTRFSQGHFGEIGKRMVFNLVPVDWRLVPGVAFDGGAKIIVRFRDAEGRLGVWWTTGDIEFLQMGQSMRLAATPKRHGNYRGQDQTDLQRVALAPEPKPAKTPRKQKE